jgi:very-short-patch-repair endonuclease
MLHGFAAVTVPTVVHVTGRSPRSAPGLCVTRSAYSPAHVSSVDGLAVVVPPLAIVGTAQVLPFDEAVVVADSALRSGAVGPDEFKGDLSSVTQRPAVARVLRFADGRSESVGESLARVALDAAGIPTPELQRELVAAARTYRVDFYWPEHRTIGEFDGRVKYGADPAVLFDEKRREDELRALGLSFVRFGTAETRDLARLRAVVHAGFRQGDRLGG